MMSGSRTPPYLSKQPSFFADNSPTLETGSVGSISVPSPLSHRGAHRDGFSIESKYSIILDAEKADECVSECRDVLVRHCSRIPRNYSFKDGIHQVYWILREYLGDENMDLAIAQLYELIELPSDWTDDEGAAFQSWKHDYMLRNVSQLILIRLRRLAQEAIERLRESARTTTRKYHSCSYQT